VSMMPDDEGALASASDARAGAAGVLGPRSSPVMPHHVAPPLATAPPFYGPPATAAPPASPPLPASAAPESERRFACPHCGAIARWRAEMAGKQLRCPRCRNVFRCPE